jgi:hypothetical protein
MLPHVHVEEIIKNNTLFDDNNCQITVPFLSLSLSLSSLCLAGEALSIIAFIWNDCKKECSFINIPA